MKGESLTNVPTVIAVLLKSNNWKLTLRECMKNRIICSEVEGVLFVGGFHYKPGYKPCDLFVINSSALIG